MDEFNSITDVESDLPPHLEHNERSPVMSAALKSEISHCVRNDVENNASTPLLS